jgi:hypothetical protein
MMKIKVYMGAAGSFNVWAHVSRRSDSSYMLIFEDDIDGLSGMYYLNQYREFVAL